MKYLFRGWRLDGTWKRLHAKLRGDVREALGRHRQPSAGIIDSQSGKTPEGEPPGYDADKKSNGRKRHLLVDPIGLVLVGVIHAANFQDRDGARLVLAVLRSTCMRRRLSWADGGDTGQLLNWVRSLRSGNKLTMEIVKRSDAVNGFQVLPRRWVVERTFGWLGRHRRLSKDNEYLPETSETLVYIAMIGFMARRLARG